MNFIKRQAAGFYLTVLTILTAAASLVFYLVNCKTAYFASFGVDGILVALAMGAILAECVFLAAGERSVKKPLVDLLPPAAAVLLAVLAAFLISNRANSIAAIITFENNAQNMADLASALAAMISGIIALIISITASFFEVVKE